MKRRINVHIRVLLVGFCILMSTNGTSTRRAIRKGDFRRDLLGGGGGVVHGRGRDRGLGRGRGIEDGVSGDDSTGRGRDRR